MARFGPSEAEFQRQVVQLARLRGWRVFWCRPVRVQRKNGTFFHETPFGADGAGWPDLFLVRGGRALALELKVGKNQPSAAQEAWLAALNAVFIPALVYRPEDWAIIESTLE